METWVSHLIVSAPSAAAVIIVVVLFLSHLKAERESRDATQAIFLDTISKLSTPISELTTEVKLLRESHNNRPTHPAA